ELAPDAVIGPESEVFIGRALQIEAADFRRTHGEKRETTIVMRIKQFLGGWRGLGEDAEPAKRIIAFVNGEYARGNSGTRNTVEAVAAGNEVTIETFGTFLAGGIVAEGDVRCGGLERVKRYVRG